MAPQAQEKETLAEYIKAVRRLLLKLDNMINNFEGTPFEHEYHNTRIIVDLGIRHKDTDGNNNSKEESKAP